MFFAGCIILGLAAGFLSALLGIGGGVVIMPLLLVLLGVKMKVAVGTSLACIVPLTLTGALLKHGNNMVDWKIVLWVIPFGVLGAYLGHQLSSTVPDMLLKRIFGGLLVLVAIKFIIFPQGWEGLLVDRDTDDEAVAQTETPVAENPAETD